MDSAQSDAVVGVAVESGNAEDVSAIAHSKKALLPRLAGFDDSSDEYFDDSVAVRSPSKATQPHPRLSGFDDLSDEYFICVGAERNARTRHSERNVLHPFASRRTRHSKRNVLLEQQIEESLLFRPADVDPCRCQALNFVRVQCHHLKVPGTRLCRYHQRTQFHGCVRGALPSKALAEFRDHDCRMERKNGLRQGQVQGQGGGRRLRRLR